MAPKRKQRRRKGRTWWAVEYQKSRQPTRRWELTVLMSQRQAQHHAKYLRTWHYLTKIIKVVEVLRPARSARRERG